MAESYRAARSEVWVGWRLVSVADRSWVPSSDQNPCFRWVSRVSPSREEFDIKYLSSGSMIALVILRLLEGKRANPVAFQ